MFIGPIMLFRCLLLIVCTYYVKCQNCQVNLTQFRQEVLDEHNRLRLLHGAPELVMDTALHLAAQTWVRHMVTMNRLESRSMINRKLMQDLVIGENIFGLKSNRPTLYNGATITNTYYNEMKQYDFNRPGFTPKAAKFTQLVWKSTKSLGCGIAYTANCTILWSVCNYQPSGNIPNTPEAFQANVSPYGGGQQATLPVAAPPPVSGPTVAARCANMYSARLGDTCQSLAASLRLTVQQLQWLNPNLPCHQFLPIGQQVCVRSYTSRSPQVIPPPALPSQTFNSWPPGNPDPGLTDDDTWY